MNSRCIIGEVAQVLHRLMEVLTEFYRQILTRVCISLICDDIQHCLNLRVLNLVPTVILIATFGISTSTCQALNNQHRKPTATHLAKNNSSAISLQEHGWGFINEHGVFVIAPQFDGANEFHAGTAVINQLVSEPNSQIKSIRIDKSGIPIRLPNFGEMKLRKRGNFYNGVAIAQVENFSGDFLLISSSGKLLKKLPYKPSTFLTSMDFFEGFALAEVNDRMGYMNTKGELAIKPEFRLANEFHDGLAAVFNGARWGYIDVTGKLVIPYKFLQANDFHEHLARVCLSQDRTKVEFIDKTGNQKLSFRNVERANNFSEGVACLARMDNTAIAIDHHGREVMHVSDCSDIGEFHSGKCCATTKKNDEQFVGYLNHQGNWSITPQFLYAKNFSEKLAPACVYRKRN